MKSDTLILKRFTELDAEALVVAGTRRSSQYGADILDTKAFTKWATSCLSLLSRVFGSDSDHYVNFRTRYDDYNGWASALDPCHGILQAAAADYSGGYLFRVRSLVRADVLDTVLEQALTLLDAGHKDAACLVVGVALESTLKEMSAQHGVAEAKLDKMNTDLCKADAYNMGMQKQVTAWAHWRNKAAHGEWDEYTESDVRHMLEGVRRFVAENL